MLYFNGLWIQTTSRLVVTVDHKNKVTVFNLYGGSDVLCDDIGMHCLC